MNNRDSYEIKLPRRTLDISALAEESAMPEEALMLLSRDTYVALGRLPDSARLEVRDILFELGRAIQNTAFPVLRVELDLELEPPQDWVASVAIQGNVVRSFTHSKAEVAMSLGVREAIVQATAMGIRSRSDMLADWSIALGNTCEELDEIAMALRAMERARDMAGAIGVDADKLKLNEEGDANEG
jgi:hypothetical protein